MPRFEWDQLKSEWNLRHRGFDFEFAAQVFEADHLVWPSAGEHQEARYLAVGPIETRLFVVVFTYRAHERIRIISARRASAKEVRLYQAAIQGRER